MGRERRESQRVGTQLQVGEIRSTVLLCSGSQSCTLSAVYLKKKKVNERVLSVSFIIKR